MLPQYKLVTINLALSILLIIVLLVYRQLFPKRKINLLYLLILISILPIVSIFRAGTYESGDLSLHATRLMSFYNLFFNHHLIPRWTPELNAGFGDPHFLFAYFLPYFFSSVFHFLGFSFLGSIKLLLAFSFILSGITMYFWVKEELGKKSGFVAAIFYLFMPYHLVDMHFRVTIAETLSFVFLPFILLSIKKKIENRSKKWFIFLSVSLALLILSHQAISILFLPFMIFYSLFIFFRLKKASKKIKNMLFLFISIAFGFLLTCFYWLPIFFLAKYTQMGSNPPPILFPSPDQLLYSSWRYGLLFQGHKGELSYLVGYIQLFTVILSSYLLFRNAMAKKLKNLLIFFLLLFLILFFLILPIAKPIWEVTPFLKYSQFSTRLLVILSICISIIAGIAVRHLNKTWFTIAICFLAISYTILNWGNRRTIPTIQDDYLKREFSIKPDISGLEPSSPIWADLNKSKLRTTPYDKIEIIEGKADITEIFRNPIQHIYTINSKSDVEIKENTLYFPGWTVESNDKLVPINYQNPHFPGVITFKLKKGLYKVNIRYNDLPVIIFSKILSFASFIIFFAYAVSSLKISKSKRLS